jgi:hypothetical protein
MFMGLAAARRAPLRYAPRNCTTFSSAARGETPRRGAFVLSDHRSN